jgi:uncharacterized protein
MVGDPGSGLGRARGPWYVVGPMIVFESERVRRLVGRLERGQSIPGAFADLAREHGVQAGWIRGLGALEWVELCEYDQEAQRYRASQRFDTPCEILSLEGNLSSKDGAPFAHVHVTVSREVDDRVEVLGGHLLAGQVFACEFTVDCFDDLSLDRERDDATGLSLWVEGGAPPSTPAADPGAVSWDQVAAASSTPREEPRPTARRGTRGRPRLATGRLPPAPRPEPLPDRRRISEEEFLEEQIPERGDFIDHRQFGRCRVEGEDSEGGLRIRLPTGVRKIIRLEMLQVDPPRHEDGKRVYPVRPRTRR